MPAVSVVARKWLTSDAWLPIRVIYLVAQQPVDVVELLLRPLVNQTPKGTSELSFGEVLSELCRVQTY